MSKEIMKVTATEALSLGETFAKSGMFPDIKTAQQAVVKILAGQEIGIPPFAAMSGIHIISGKPTIGAGLMAATVKGSGKYDFRVVEQTDQICTIDFFQGKEKIGTSTFTIQDAKKAGTKNLEKFPKNMLFARAMSNGVKWFTPDIFSGPVYVPEEMENITEDAPAVVVEPAKKQLTDAQLDKALVRIHDGDVTVYDLVTSTFIVTDEQLVKLNEAKQTIKPADNANSNN